MATVSNELELLDATSTLASAAQDQWKATATGFRPFALFEPKEVVQTRIIAGLLDPGGSHGQGDNFLQFFLEEIGEGTGLPRALGSSQITTEALTESIESDRRRIDLLIRLPNGRHIALESKARNAEDQPGQIKSYLDHLEVVAPKNHLLVYLSPREGKPADVDEDTWIHWTKGDLCRTYGISRPTVYRWINRYNETGPEGPVDRSSRPHSCSHATLEPIENTILVLRAIDFFNTHARWRQLKSWRLHKRGCFSSTSRPVKPWSLADFHEDQNSGLFACVGQLS